ncbi:hypothetical protein Acr_00g0055250 [Actinidia rufa]|uniref:Uncharacterized protein n=1 Tax=Actinidia rufa TaxID=165716 RepID=A0A7J0DNV1_9ERIC|nr:hypothetical protein Acr_00g0055250 [Actinidia rufa]
MEGVAEDLRVKVGECAVNIGDVVEMECQGHLILRVDAEADMVVHGTTVNPMVTKEGVGDMVVAR